MRHLVTVILLALVPSCARGPARAPRASNTPEVNQLTATLDSQAPALLAKYRVPAVGVALIEDGRIVLERVYGKQGPGIPASPTTLFNVASLTKAITAETILRLVAAGQFSLDEPLSRYWVDPDVANDRRHELLTPRISLSHQTGFPNWRSENNGGRLAFNFTPGTAFGYSGEGYNYLARFAEKKLGRSFESLAQEYLFDPVGMTSTSYSSRAWMTGRTAIPADTAGNLGKPEIPPEGKWDAANNVSTTVRDYALFAISVMKGEKLTPALATERLRLHRSSLEGSPCAGKSADSLCPGSAGLSLGWERFDYPQATVMMHLGGNKRPDGAGESTMVYYYLGTRRGVVILTNGRNGESVNLDIVGIVDPHWPILPLFRAARQ
jgi:CubicO group peptidase (beta-lactamase class C family)